MSSITNLFASVNSIITNTMNNRMNERMAASLNENGGDYEGCSPGPYDCYVLGKFYDSINYTTRLRMEQSIYLWTYRTMFAEMVPYGLTSDAGWGCMLRVSQMLLSQCLRVHVKGHDWMHYGDNSGFDDMVRCASSVCCQA